jgi:uncharacterized protein YaeQ
MHQWLQQNLREFARIDSLFVRHFDPGAVQTLADQLERTMELSCMIQDGALTLGFVDQMLEIGVQTLYPEPAR